MKMCFKLLAMVILVISNFSLVVSQSISTPPSSGDGSADNPFEISIFENLVWLTENSGQWDKNFIQTANIDASQTSTWDDGRGNLGWNPIGTESVPFSGVYEGGGFLVSNLFMQQPNSNNLGFFGVINGGDVNSLGITSSSIAGNEYVGGFAGSVIAGRVVNCFFKGDVQGNNYVGGFAGLATFDGQGVVTQSYTASSVSGAGDFVGGFFGSQGTTLDEMSCFWDINVSGMENGVGGSNFQIGFSPIGRTTEQMRLYETYIAAGWDFIGEDINGNAEIWGIDETGVDNNGYPFFSSQNLNHNVINHYIVTFYNYDSTTVLKQENVIYNGASQPPEDPQRAGYEFVGWSNPYDMVRRDTEIYALFEPPTSIKINNLKLTVTLGPNPIQKELKVNISSANEYIGKKIKVTIIDSKQRIFSNNIIEVYDNNLEHFIDVQQLKPGICFLYLKIEGEGETKKIFTKTY